MESYDVAVLPPEQRDRYARIRAKGTSHRLAVILASEQAPRTDRKDERWRLSDESRDWGRKMPKGKYQTGLARYPGDPRAFVSSRGEARKVAEKQGLQIHDGPANNHAPMQQRSQRRPNADG